MSLIAEPRLPIAAKRGAAVEASLCRLPGDGPLVGFFRLRGGQHRGAIGVPEGETIARCVRMASESGVPVVGVIASSGADIQQGVASLHAWGTVARALTAASGVVPTVLVVDGPCVSGPALLLGLADVVIVTGDAFAYVSGPAAVNAFTGIETTHRGLGGAAVHATRSGVASLVAADEDDALELVVELLAYLPANNLGHPPAIVADDPVDRPTRMAAAVVPKTAAASYDVRTVIEDVVDHGALFELKGRHAANVVTGLAHVGGHPVGVVANQPSQLAGTLDIAASQKAARFVQWCDAFNLPIVSFIDTTGYQPGKDIEWRGMIRHGAELVHAYAAATVPRVGVILRKAYGGAYIVMDSKTMGNDLMVCWPDAEIAVMGAPQAIGLLHKRDDLTPEQRAKLEAEYAETFCTPAMAVARGYVDDVIEPETTRLVIAEALVALADKRDHPVRRRHSNGPL